MPLYEYQCDQCGDVFELIQRFSDQPLSVHPKCGGPVHRLISAPALQFKGTGWYITDYGRSGSSAAGGSADKNGSDKSESGSKSTSEKKTTSESKSDSSKPSPASSPSAGK